MTRTKDRKWFIKLKKSSLSCIYCGLPFDVKILGLPEKGEPHWRKARFRAKLTKEHLHAKIDGGKATSENIRLAHSLCNTFVDSRSVAEKEALFGKLIPDFVNKIVEVVK